MDDRPVPFNAHGDEWWKQAHVLSTQCFDRNGRMKPNAMQHQPPHEDGGVGDLHTTKRFPRLLPVTTDAAAVARHPVPRARHPVPSAEIELQSMRKEIHELEAMLVASRRHNALLEATIRSMTTAPCA